MLIRAVHVSTSLLSTIGSGFFQFLFECEGVVAVGAGGGIVMCMLCPKI